MEDADTFYSINIEKLYEFMGDIKTIWNSNDLYNIIKLGNFYKGGSCLAMNISW